MAVTKGVWGIDIGQCALKALRLELIDGKPTATAFDYVEHTKILSQPDADPDTLIREALEKFLSRNDLKTDDVAVGIAGQSGLARFVKLPPVEEKKIAEIVKFEAKQQIPFPLDEVVWDYQKIAGGGAVDGFALETEIGLFAMKRDVISRYLGYFTGTKTEIHLVQMSPLALVNFATFELLKTNAPAAPGIDGAAPPPEEENPTPRGKKRCTVVMDVGTDASNLIITDGGKIIWQRPIPLGGNNFTRALTKELKLTFAKAEHLKRNAAKSPDMASILKAIKPVLTDFVGEVQRSLGYFTNTHRDAHVAYLVGLGSAFKLPGLQKYLADKLSLEVKKPTRFEKLGGDTVTNDPLFLDNLLTFPIAYGLALQGLGQARLTTNLLPKEIAQDRLIRKKKPAAAAAAALLLVGVGGLAMGFSSPYAAVKDDRIDKGIDKAKQAASAFDKQTTEFNNRIGSINNTQAERKKVIAGQEERLNWPRWVEVFTTTLPRPGPDGNLNETSASPNSNVPVFNQEMLWRGEGNAGIEALKWFKTRMQEGVTVDNALADENSQHPKNLAMVNIETVHTRWVSDPNAFLQAADKQAQEKFNEAIADWMLEAEREQDPTVTDKDKPRFRPKYTGPAGEGVWVIEIRGWTDYDPKAKDAAAIAGPVFIRQSLLRNLQRTNDFATKGEQKVGQYIPDAKDPIKGRVSHAFVYRVFQASTDAPPNEFFNINRGSFLDGILGGSAAPGTDAQPGMGGMGSMVGPPMPGPMGGPMGGPPPTAGGGGGGAASGAAIAPKWDKQLGNTGGAPTGGLGEKSPPQSTRKDNSTPRRRHEFVVMMIWREPAEKGAEAPKAP